MEKWKEEVVKHYNDNNRTYTQNDFIQHFADEDAGQALKTWIRKNKHKPMKEFAGGTSNEWAALVAPAFQAEVATYGIVSDLPDGLITNVSADRDHVKKRWVWKSEPIEDYVEGEEFKATYIEGATAIDKWRKPGAKIVNTYEAIKDTPLNIVTMNLNLTANEFKAREWRHFTHELHKSTSDAFPTNSTDKNGNPLVINGWRHLFDNAISCANMSTCLVDWSDIRDARRAMLRRQRDAVMPNVVIMNATVEAHLSDDDRVNLAHYFGGADTFFRTGTLPNIYGLTPVVIPDSWHGYFTNDVTRKNDEFVPTNDVFLLTTNNGPTMLRYTREPLSTETWRIYDGQQEAINIWERYNYGCFRYTNIERISCCYELGNETVTLS